MASIDHLETVEALADALELKGFEPVLVGGMALVILGSQRVTKDFDFVVSAQGAQVQALVAIMYRHDLRLVTKLGATGEVVRTVDNPRVATAKVKAESPRSLFFANEATRLRVDLLLDYPFTAHSLRRHAVATKLQSRRIPVAAPEDLLKLKEVAYSDRKSPSDAQDLQFLRKLLGKDR